LFQPSQLSAGDSSKSGGGVIVVDAAAMKEAEAAASAAQQPTVAYIKVSYIMYRTSPHSIIIIIIIIIVFIFPPCYNSLNMMTSIDTLKWQLGSARTYIVEVLSTLERAYKKVLYGWCK
jgi:hypothetical protein